MRRNFRSATNNIFHTTAVALATFLNRFAASVRSRNAANGDSITLLVSQVPPVASRESVERHHLLPVLVDQLGDSLTTVLEPFIQVSHPRPAHRYGPGP